MKKEILIIRLSSIGDVLHCTPVASSLKKAWPDCKISWLVGEVSAELLKYNPYVDEVLVWSREQFERHLRNYEFKQALSMWEALRKQLGARRFDAVLDIHGLFLSGMIARLAPTKRRIGLSDARELNSLFMTETAKPLGRHVTDRYLGVLTPLGITVFDHRMVLTVPEREQNFAAAFLENAGVFPNNPVVVLIPGTTWLSKNWPTRHFAQTAQKLAQDFKIVLCGGKAEQTLGAEIEKLTDIPLVNAIGKTSLLEMAGILQRAAVVVTGDTGPLHIAAALGTPTVSIFGPTDPAVYAPKGSQNTVLYPKVPCAFCHKMNCPHGKASCMTSTSAAEVVKTVYQLLRSKPPAVYDPRWVSKDYPETFWISDQKRIQ